MSLPRRERRLLTAIDHEVATADPGLARQFDEFGSPWAGAPLPGAEQLGGGTSGFLAGQWDALCADSWLLPSDPGVAGAGPGTIDAAWDQSGQGPGRPGQERRDDR